MADVNFSAWKTELFRSGNLGAIRLGIPKEKMLSAFGQPDSMSVDEKVAHPLVLKYEDMQFHFDRQNLLRVIYTPDTDRIPRHFTDA